MATSPSISFGDTVRVRATPETTARGLAGLTGQVRGVTTPSAMAVDVIGPLMTDCAFNVFLEHREADFWFPAELIEFVDHAPGTVIGVDGAPMTWVRDASGEWKENRTKPTKPWWKFW